MATPSASCQRLWLSTLSVETKTKQTPLNSEATLEADEEANKKQIVPALGDGNGRQRTLSSKNTERMKSEMSLVSGLRLSRRGEALAKLLAFLAYGGHAPQ